MLYEYMKKRIFGPVHGEKEWCILNYNALEELNEKCRFSQVNERLISQGG